MKMNTIVLMLYTCIILLSLVMIYVFICHLARFCITSSSLFSGLICISHMVYIGPHEIHDHHVNIVTFSHKGDYRSSNKLE